jgi:GT2 family glycosyltransferase
VTAPTTPFVRVVVINFDGWQMTIDCLESLLATEWPADRMEIVLVDNGSLDDVVERVRVELPQVRILEPLANLGFAGGCNLGIRAAGSFDHVALVNNDATVEPGWLRPLVSALEAEPRVGAACPKLLFDGRFVEAEVEVPDAGPLADPRTLGARLVGARIDGARDDERLAFDEGWFGAEQPTRELGEEVARWSWRRGRVRVRVDGIESPQELALHVTAPELRHVTVRTRKDEATVVIQPGADAWITVALDPEPFDVINNAGSALYPGGYGGDRGFLERDAGQFDEPTDVFAWCGGAVLLAKPYLDDVGLFDERLFLYYEDTDLSWRGRLRGWRYVYEPTSRVRHRHAASSGGPSSAVFRFYTERNRVLMLAKNAPTRLALVQGLLFAKRAAQVEVRDRLLRALSLRGPATTSGPRQWVLVSYVRWLPAMLRDRWRSGRVVGRRSVLSWTITKETAG